MKQGGTGGANTGSGLIFEDKADLFSTFNATPGYSIRPRATNDGSEVLYELEPVALCFKKHQFYKYLEAQGVAWKDVLSKRLLPDNALLVIFHNTLFIIEVKYQAVEGSVDEKLQTCDFKRKQYTKLVKPLNLRVEYVYVLNDWFKQDKYADTLEYIKNVGCSYWFQEIPLSWLGLPVADEVESQ
ncbi:MAG: hypothetical protein OXE93_08785 [bacterium]|nr:hypothetical protein [bacterium]